MDVEGFKASLQQAEPPDGLNAALRALWHQAKGNWDRAHGLVQAQRDADGAWVHAHLHRAAGEAGNAGYWYRHAGRPPSQARLDAEWEQIASALLAARR